MITAESHRYLPQEGADKEMPEEEDVLHEGVGHKVGVVHHCTKNKKKKTYLHSYKKLGLFDKKYKKSIKDIIFG